MSRLEIAVGGAALEFVDRTGVAHTFEVGGLRCARVRHEILFAAGGRGSHFEVRRGGAALEFVDRTGAAHTFPVGGLRCARDRGRLNMRTLHATFYFRPTGRVHHVRLVGRSGREPRNCP